MKQPLVLRKLAVVASSLLLVSSFVSYRVGAFNWLTKSGVTQPADTILGGSKSKVLVVPPRPDTTDIAPQDTTQQPLATDTQTNGEAATLTFVGRMVGTAASTNAPPDLAIMSGSKSYTTVIRVSDLPAMPSFSSAQTSKPNP